MPEKMPQTFENHTRLVPAFHMVAFPIFALNFLWSAYQLVRFPSIATVMGTLVAVALIILFFCARIFALRAQDRVIRLEMRLRLARVLPREQQSCIDNLTIDQLVALRFASDDELPGLCRKVVDERIANRKQIKQLIKTWTPDYLRV